MKIIGMILCELWNKIEEYLQNLDNYLKKKMKYKKMKINTYINLYYRELIKL